MAQQFEQGFGLSRSMRLAGAFEMIGSLLFTSIFGKLGKN